MVNNEKPHTIIPLGYTPKKVFPYITHQTIHPTHTLLIPY